MDILASILLMVIIQTTAGQVTEEGQCLRICAESWPDTQPPIGPPGPPGAPGLSGPVGRQGEPGVIGPAGTPGVKGERGQKGIKGDIGTKGEQGGFGAKGQTGLPGNTGPQGPRGERGRNGAKGDTGTPGVKGQKGEVGGVVEQPKVAFIVIRRDPLFSAKSEQTITYTDVTVSESANINITTGVFTCEIPGIYYFSFTFRSFSNKAFSAYLTKNDDIHFGISQPPQSGYNTYSQSGMLQLSEGDEVKLKMPGDSDYYVIWESRTNIFNGFLVYPD